MLIKTVFKRKCLQCCNYRSMGNSVDGLENQETRVYAQVEMRLFLGTRGQVIHATP
jgi:hypothetical protein